MKRIPRHVITRNRNAVEAERSAQFYAPAPKVGGPCAVCGKVEDDHIFGVGDDGHPYAAADPKPAEQGRLF